MWRAGETVVFGVSGGADSTALLLAACELPRRLRPRAVAAYFHHGLRPEADAELAGVAALAHGLSIPFVSGGVRSALTGGGRSLEAAARDARYAFLAAAAAQAGGGVVAVAHQADDGAETVLLRLARGAGSRGLSAIRPVRPLGGAGGWRGRLVRPLWRVPRAQVEEYLRLRGRRWHEDVSNSLAQRPRAAVRLEVLPALERACGAGVRAALLRAAENLAEDEAALSQWAAREAARRCRGDRVDVGAGFDRLPAAIRFRVIARAWTGLTGAPSLGRAQVLQVLELRDGGRVDLPRGWTARRAAAELIFFTAGQGPGECVLEVPGRMEVAGWGRLEASLRPAHAGMDGGRDVAVGDAAGVALPLRVRAPRRGERWRVRGAEHRGRAVRELLREAGVAPAARHGPCLVTDADGRALWVAGGRPALGFAVTEATRRVLRLEFQRVCPPESAGACGLPVSLS